MSFAGVDPGFSDVVTVEKWTSDPHAALPSTSSYSSSRYYEKAKIKVSKRRTDRWNTETSQLAAALSSDGDLTSADGMRSCTSQYLAVLRRLVRHRMSRGYRNMRFMRSVHKQKAVDEICDLIAPPGLFTVVGYGDRNGASGSPISRRCSGPQQDIKRELMRRSKTAALRHIDEFRTSILCSTTWQRMVNMVATSHTRDRRTGEMVQRRKSKIHKVLHCKTSVAGIRRTETTWNRDINAAKNILMILMTELHGFERPVPFCRPKKNTALRRRAPRGRAA